MQTEKEKAGAVEPIVKPTSHCIHGVWRSEHCPQCFSHEKISKLEAENNKLREYLTMISQIHYKEQKATSAVADGHEPLVIFGG